MRMGSTESMPHRRRPGTAILLSAVLLLVLAGCGRPASEADSGSEDVLAEVGGRRILRADLEREMATRGRSADPGTVLGELVRFELDLAEARRAGIEDEPGTRRAVERLLVSRLHERRPAAAAAAVADAEVAALYDREADRFTRPAAVRGSVLRVAVSPKADPEARARRAELAEALRAKAESLDGTGFQSLVRERSDDAATRYSGGDTGWIPDGESGALPAAVADALRGLAVSDRALALVETTNAFHIVRFRESRPAARRPLAEVAEGLRHRLRLAKAEELERARVQALMERTPVRTNLAALTALAKARESLSSVPALPPTP